MAGKNILMVIAPKNYRDEEFFVPKSLFEKSRAKVTVSSRGITEATGALGGVASVDIDVRKANLDDFDAVVFVGGPGASVYFDDAHVLTLAEAAVKQGKVVGAICIAPSILANAGVLEGKIVTAFSSEKKNIEASGAKFTGDDVTVDGRIITGNGPGAAEKFANEIIKLLT